MRLTYVILFLALLLAGCGTLKPPAYQASLESEAAPAPVLFVTTLPQALLPQQAGIDYARDLANALADYGVPTTTTPTAKQGWRLKIAASATGPDIAPTYQIIGPDQKCYAQVVGEKIPAQEWIKGDQSVLLQAALHDSQHLANVLTAINTQVQQHNPDALANRTPRLFISNVTGAPDDGDMTLPVNLTKAFTHIGVQLVHRKENADFSVAGHVHSLSLSQNVAAMEIDWIVRDSNNRLVGQVTQLRELHSPPSVAWTTLAPTLAPEAANGIFSVIHNDMIKSQKNATKPQDVNDRHLTSP